jgi:ureidoglycolate lyase
MIPPHTGVNIHRNVWHGVLTPLHEPGLFTVIDRVSGDGNNVEEYFFDTPYIIKG